MERKVMELSDNEDTVEDTMKSIEIIMSRKNKFLVRMRVIIVLRYVTLSEGPFNTNKSRKNQISQHINMRDIFFQVKIFPMWDEKVLGRAILEGLLSSLDSIKHRSESKDYEDIMKPLVIKCKLHDQKKPVAHTDKLNLNNCH